MNKSLEDYQKALYAAFKDVTRDLKDNSVMIIYAMVSIKLLEHLENK